VQQQPRTLVGQILPKTLAGLAVWILLFAAGVAAAGVILFFWYSYRLESTKRAILSESRSFLKDVDDATKKFEDLVKESRGEVEKASAGSTAASQELTKLLEKVGPGIAHIQGKAQDGAPTSGTGFVVLTNDKESWVITTYNLVAGAVADKSQISISIGEDKKQASVYSWDPSSDLALAIIRTGGATALTDWAKGELQLGTRVFAVGSSPGRFGSAAAQGYLIDTSEAGLLTDADVPTNATGGPLVDRDGKVLGVLSLSYAPQGYAPSNGWVVPIQMACKRVLRCP
jgi:S1-C subfamily serine protease